MIFSNSEIIFQLIEKKDQHQFKSEIKKYSSEELVSCVTLIRLRFARRCNLLEACCLVENLDALHDLLVQKLPWHPFGVQKAAQLAVASKNYSFINELMIYGFSADEALLAMCREGNSDLVQKLLQEKIHDLNLASSDPVFRAAAFGYPSILKLLKENGFDLHAKEDEALCLSVRGKHIECVRYLISQGANVNTQKERALKTAVVNKSLDIVEELLANGSEIKYVVEEGLIDLAERYKCYDIANILRAKAAQQHIEPRLNVKQSTHVSSVDRSAVESILRLQASYNKLLTEAFIEETIKQLTAWSEELAQSTSDVDLAAHRAIDNLLTRNEIHKPTGISLKKILILTWAAIHDDDNRIGTLQNALEMLKEGLYEIQRGYNLDSGIDAGGQDDDICRDSQPNKFMEKLMGIHPDVEIDFVTREVASYKLKAVAREEAKKSSSLLFGSMFNKKISPEDIWKLIRETVKQRIFDEFSVLFKSYDDNDFNAFIDTGIYADIGGTFSQDIKSRSSEAGIVL